MPKKGTPDEPAPAGCAVVLGKVWAAAELAALKHTPLFPQTFPPLLAWFNGESYKEGG